MKRSVSIWLQLFFVLLFLGGSAALWFGQDHVSQVLAAFTEKPAGNSSKAPSGVPVVVAKAGERANDVVIEAIANARAEKFVTLYPEVSGEIQSIDVKAGEHVISRQQVLKLDSRDAELAVELAKVRVAEAELQLERSRQLLAKNVNSKAKVQDMITVLERMRLELNQAEENLSKRTLRAPFPGVVGIPKVEAGDRVSPTTAIITIDDRSTLIVEIEAPEQYLSTIQPGQKVEAETPSFPGRSFEGKVDMIDSRVDPLSRTVIVRASIANSDDLLRPGMSFAVRLVVKGKVYPSVPELALQWAKGESFVWKVVDGKSTRVPVRSVRRLSREILVDGNISKGDIVIVEGVQRLRPGREVSFSLPDPPPGS